LLKLPTTFHCGTAGERKYEDPAAVDS